MITRAAATASATREAPLGREQRVGMYARFGFLTSEPPGWRVLSGVEIAEAPWALWRVECSGCGRKKFVPERGDGGLFSLPRCPCLWQTAEYVLVGRWLSMLRRCYDESVTGFWDYGGRGIEVCARWRESFAAFAQCVGHRPPGRSPRNRSKFSLDRVDNDGHYAPGNVRWATAGVQNANRERLHEVQPLGCESGKCPCAVARRAADAQIVPGGVQ